MADLGTVGERARPGMAMTGLLLGLSLLAAAGADAEKLRRDVEINGPRLNGVELIAPDGHTRLSLLVVRLNKAATVQGTRLVASGGSALAPGALLAGEASDHAAVRLRIDRIETAADPKPDTPANENADVFRYAVSYQWINEGTAKGAAAGDWKPLCPEGELAIALAGRWNYHRGQPGDSGRVSSDPELATFACSGSAIAKCVERMGYKPWLPSRRRERGGAVSMDALHQACVRAVRADYCGNGDSLTTAGQRVNFHDVSGLLRDSESWALEAGWTPAGAVCVNGTRLAKLPDDPRQTTSGYIARTCLTAWSQTPCAGAKRSAPALLFTEIDPSPAAATNSPSP